MPAVTEAGATKGDGISKPTERTTSTKVTQLISVIKKIRCEPVIVTLGKTGCRANGYYSRYLTALQFPNLKFHQSGICTVA